MNAQRLAGQRQPSKNPNLQPPANLNLLTLSATIVRRSRRRLPQRLEALDKLANRRRLGRPGEMRREVVLAPDAVVYEVGQAVPAKLMQDR